MAEKFIRFCISHIVSQPESVSLEVREDEDATRYQLTVHTDDMKRVIGRSGKTIRALQSLVRVIGIKQNKKLFLNLVEPCSPQ
ncbi:MAG: KH domain-containing protein [bacterium]